MVRERPIRPSLNHRAELVVSDLPITAPGSKGFLLHYALAASPEPTRPITMGSR